MAKAAAKPLDALGRRTVRKRFWTDATPGHFLDVVVANRSGGAQALLDVATFQEVSSMTSYPRLEKGRAWEQKTQERPWLYQTPEEILIKASNGASDFGNKFGQPLICGSLLTFEHQENDKYFGYDKVIMLAGGIGFGVTADSL